MGVGVGVGVDPFLDRPVSRFRSGWADVEGVRGDPRPPPLDSWCVEGDGGYLLLGLFVVDPPNRRRKPFRSPMIAMLVVWCVKVNVDGCVPACVSTQLRSVADRLLFFFVVVEVVEDKRERIEF